MAWVAAVLPVVAVSLVTWLENPGLGINPATLFLAATLASGSLLILLTRANSEHLQRELWQVHRLMRRATSGDVPAELPPFTNPTIQGLASESIELARRVQNLHDRLDQTVGDASYALERKKAEFDRITQEITRLRNDTSILRDFGGAINRQLGPAQLCGHLITSIPSEVEFALAGVVLVSESDGEIIPAAIRELPKPALYGDFLKQVPAGQIIVCGQLVQWVIQTGKAACVTDSLSDNRCGDPGGPFRSMLAIPLRGKDKIIGVVQLAHSHVGVYGKEHEQILISMANQTAIAIENVRLTQDAMQVEALRQVDRLKSELLSTVSHELRTPLASIKGYAESLLRKDVHWDDETRRDFLQIIDEESDRLGDLIEDLLQMSRIESGILRVDLQPIKVQRLVQRVVRRIRSANRGNPHTFHVAFAADFPDAQADPMRIDQVLRNLIENAIKYSPEGGHIQVMGEVAQNSVIIGVRDQGIGIDARDLPRIFDRFYRAEGEAIRRAGGTGLGLSICRGIVEKHGGRIWVESKPREGSTFKFTLPIAEIQLDDTSVE